MALLDKNIMNERNKNDLKKVKDILVENELCWTWESIYYTIYKQDVDWDTLRIYDGKFKNIITIILAGLPEDKRDKKAAFDILTKFSEAGIHPARLHKFLVEVLQERHFFTDTQEEELIQNLIEADTKDLVTLQNLIFLLASKEAQKQSYLVVKNSSNQQETPLTSQLEQPQ